MRGQLAQAYAKRWFLYGFADVMALQSMSNLHSTAIDTLQETVLLILNFGLAAGDKLHISRSSYGAHPRH
jgi:hypothetical protein